MKQNDNAFAKDLAKEFKEGKSLKDVSDVVGLPDEIDKQMIRRLILKYEKKYPGFIKQARDEAKREYQATGGLKEKYGLVNKEAAGRVLFELPEELVSWIEKAYPLMFRNKKHLHWFIKNFRELLVPEKY